jgi:hypothetical protein
MGGRYKLQVFGSNRLQVHASGDMACRTDRERLQLKAELARRRFYTAVELH